MNLKTRIVAVLAVVAMLLIAGSTYVFASGLQVVPKTTSAAASVFNEDTVTSIYDAASPAVVEINVTEQGSGGPGRFSMQAGQGSGFLIDNQGNILTNNHVVAGATSVQVVFKDGRTVDATVVGTDQIDDLALIKVDASTIAGIQFLMFTDSSTVKPGQMAIALGSPYGLTDSISVGVISGLNRTLGGNASGSSMTGMLQTDASLNPGNSGGPLLDSSGKVIGINTAIEAATGAKGIGFAVASNTATRVLPTLQAGKQVTRPYLGITGMTLDANAAKTLGITQTDGVYVVQVQTGSPAEQAGLKGAGITTGQPGTGGDVITSVDGKAIKTIGDLSTYISGKQVGDTINLTVLRGGQTLTVSATLQTWQNPTPQDIHPQLPQQTQPMPFGGMMPWGGRNRVPAQ